LGNALACRLDESLAQGPKAVEEGNPSCVALGRHDVILHFWREERLGNLHQLRKWVHGLNVDADAGSRQGNRYKFFAMTNAKMEISRNRSVPSEVKYRLSGLAPL
jgi:hypothetical protein